MTMIDKLNEKFGREIITDDGKLNMSVGSPNDIDDVVSTIEAALNAREDDKWYVNVEFSRSYNRKPPVVPESNINDADQTLVFLEQRHDFPGQYHEIDQGYDPFGYEVLTTLERAKDMDRTYPCPTCSPESLEDGGENEWMEVEYDEEGGRMMRPKETEDSGTNDQ